MRKQTEITKDVPNGVFEWSTADLEKIKSEFVFNHIFWELIFFIVFLILTMPPFIYLLAKKEYYVVAGVFALITLVLLYLMLRYLIFRITVSGSTIIVREKIWKKYKFCCSDIDEVTCITEKNHHDIKFYSMVIRANSHKIKLDLGYTGTLDMIAYLLKKVEDGEIKSKAISKASKNTLYRYYSYARVFSKENIKQSKTLEQYKTLESVQELFRSVGCEGEDNCYFVTYRNWHGRTYQPLYSMEYPYGGILINRTENGFGMFALMFKKPTLKIKLWDVAVLRDSYCFIPNEDVKRITIRTAHPLTGRDTMWIALQVANKYHYVIANVEEPDLQYHNKNLDKFLIQYQEVEGVI